MTYDINDQDVEEFKELIRLQVMMNMRIYDALLILIKQNSIQDAQILSEKHERGEWISSYPWVTESEI